MNDNTATIFWVRLEAVYFLPKRAVTQVKNITALTHIEV